MAVLLSDTSYFTAPTITGIPSEWALVQWVKIGASLPARGSCDIQSIARHSGGPEAQIRLLYRGSTHADAGKVVLFYRPSSSGATITSSSAINDGAWRLVVAQRSSGQYQVWFCTLSGTASMVASATAGQATDVPSYYNIGVQLDTSSNPVNPFGANELAEVGFVNRALTQVEIEALASGLQLEDVIGSASIVRNWALVDNTDVDDKSTNAQDLTATGTTTTATHPFDPHPSIDPPADAPTVSAPADLLDPAERPITFEWGSVADATTYQLQIATENTFAAPVYDEALAGTSRTLTYEIEPDTLYYWRVAGGNAGGTGPYSTTRSLTTDAPPITVSIPNPGVPIFTPADVATPTLYWMTPHYFPGVTYPAAADGKKYLWFYSTDHATGAGETLGWGVSDQLDGSDYVDKGVITITGLSETGETPWLVYNPDDVNGRPWYLYYHWSSAPNGQATCLASSADLVSWTDEGVVMPASPTNGHTGYATVTRHGAGDWTAYHVLDAGSPGRVTRSTSTNGKTWTYGSDIDVESMVPSGHKLSLSSATVVTMAEEDWMLTQEYAIEDPSVDWVVLVRMTDPTTFVAPRYILITPSVGVEGTTDGHGVKGYVEDDVLHIYYQMGDDAIHYATASLPDASPATPVAVIGGTEDGVTVTAGAVLHFEADSTDDDGDPLTHEWFDGDPDGDGNSLGTGDSLDYDTAGFAAGSYEVWLRSTDGALTDTTSLSFTVGAAGASARLKAAIAIHALGGRLN